jgi:hypothetical protein
LVGVILSPVAELHAVIDEPVKSGNFVTFFTQNIFLTQFREVTPYFFFFLVENSLENGLDVGMVIFGLG